MGVKTRSVERVMHDICKMRGVKGREGLVKWWAQTRLVGESTVAAA